MENTKVTKLRNIGTGLERLLAEAGITRAEEFLQHDPYDLYFKLEKNHPNLHPAVLACFVGAHYNVPWYFIYKEVKKELGIHK